MAYRSNCFITLLAPIRDYLRPQDPLSSPLCTTKDRYFNRLSVGVDLEPGIGFDESQWIVSEDVNVEYLFDVFTSIDRTEVDIWESCSHLLEHLHWHKPRQTILASKIEALGDDHPSKLTCLLWLSGLFDQVGNYVEQKRLLTHTLELGRQRGEYSRVAETLRALSDANRFLRLYGEGIQQVEEALEIYERIGVDTRGQAISSNDLAWLFFDDEQFDAAEDTVLHTTNLIPEKGNEALFCQLYRLLGLIHRTKGDKEMATNHFQTAIGIASRSNQPDELFWNHYNLADLSRQENKLDDANAHIEGAKSNIMNVPYQLAHAIKMQADIWYQQGRIEEAKSEVSHALEVYEKLGVATEARQCRDLLQKIEQVIGTRSTC